MAKETKCSECKKAEETEYTALNGIYYCHYYGGYTDGIMFDPKNCPENRSEETMEEKKVNTIIIFDPDNEEEAMILKTVLTEEEVREEVRKVCNDPRIETDEDFNCLEELSKTLQDKDPSAEVNTDVIGISLC